MAIQSLSASLLLLLGAAVSTFAQSGWQQPSLCTEGGCTDCPTFLEESGPGFPICVIYPVEQFADRFAPADEGGLEVYFDIAQPDPGCALIIRSPAGNDEEGCGQNILTARNALCTRVVLRGTFMAQFCCGSGDCQSAGGGLPARSASGSGGGMFLIDSKGQVIEPLEVGYPPGHNMTAVRNELVQTRPKRDEIVAARRAGGSTIAQRNLFKRDCDFNPIGDVYTATGPTQVLVASVRGPAMISEEYSVSVGFSTSIEVGLNIEVFSAGVSFEVSTETTRSTTVTVEVPDGQTGALVWTATLQCQMGTLSGDGCSGEGEGCVGAVDGEGNFIGTAAFQIRA